MKLLPRIIVIIIVIGAVIGGGYWFYQNSAANDVATDTSDFTQVVPVQQGDIDASISVVGELDALQTADLSIDRIQGSATLQSLEVEPGYEVEVGRILAAIDLSPYQQALDQAESAADRLYNLVVNTDTTNKKKGVYKPPPDSLYKVYFKDCGTLLFGLGNKYRDEGFHQKAKQY